VPVDDQSGADPQPVACAGPGGLRALLAHQRTVVRARRCRVRKLEHPELRSFVETMLVLQRSPAQISQELGRAPPGRPQQAVVARGDASMYVKRRLPVSLRSWCW